jgi:uncharacterized membrane protein YdbT with pleckstrin-like domain
MWHLTVFMVVGVWVFPLFLWVHHTVFYNYRLTTRALYREHGLQRTADEEIPLSLIAGVAVEASVLDRFLGIGRIRITVEGRPSYALEGIPEPELVAALIQRSVERSTQRQQV